MSDAIYQQRIKQLAKAEVCKTALQHADRKLRKDNPLCGDRVEFEVVLQGVQLQALSQNVRGCLLCRAAANLIAARAPGCTGEELSSIHAAVKAMLRSQPTARPWPPAAWQDLELFEPVAPHKARHGCVLLPFETLLEAMSGPC